MGVQEYFEDLSEEDRIDLEFMALASLVDRIHAGNVKAGWWNDPVTGEPLKRNVGELLALQHSEISEALEGARKDLMDDHLPQYKMFIVEQGDLFIRTGDICGSPIGGGGRLFAAAVRDKMNYNANRPDHKKENRLKENGKKF